MAQEYLLDLQTITQEDGLASFQTSAVYQDSRGLLWIGTKYGLNQYNGYEFQIFNKERNGLFNNSDIFRIAEDESGHLWVYYGAGNSIGKWQEELVTAIDIVDPVIDAVTPLAEYLEDEMPFSLSDIKVSHSSGHSDHIWIQTKSGDLFLYQDRAFKKIYQIANDLIYTLTGNSEQVWFNKKGTQGKGREVLCLDLNGNLIDKFLFPEMVHGIWLSEEKEIWVATKTIQAGSMNFSIWRKNKKSKKFEPFLFTDDHLIKNNKPRNIWMHRDSKGFWYFRAEPTEAVEPHLYVFDHLGKKIFDLHKGLKLNSIPNRFAFCEGKENVWFLAPIGLLKTRIAKNPFQLIHSQEEYSDCRGIVEDESGNIYFQNRKIYQYNPNTHEVDSISSTSGSAYSLFYLDSTIVSSRYSNITPLYQINLRTGKEIDLENSEHGAPTYTFLPLEEPGQYLSAHEKGLNYFDFHEKKPTAFNRYNEFDTLKSLKIYHLHKNNSGVWLATENGVYLMDQEQGIVRRFSNNSGDLPFDHIKHINEDKDGVFWLATEGGGIIRWEPSLDKNKPSTFQQFTISDGLPDNYTYAVYPDEFGNLWVPSNKGLMQINKSTFLIRTFLTEDGLPHNEFNTSSHYRAKDGTFYFGGLGGLISFRPSSFSESVKNQAPLAFTSFHVWEDGQENMTDRTNLLHTSDQILIKPTDKLFEIKFVLLDFEKPENHSYAYQIEGYDDRWQYTKENYLRITNLPYGNYRLNIKGRNNNTGWSEQQLHVDLKVLKPFYLQWWFITLIAFAIVVLAWAYMRQRERRLHLEQERLEKEVQNRTRTIQQQAEELKTLDKAKTRFFSNITHEFRTPLTLVIGPLEQLVHDTNLAPLARRKLWGISKNAKHLLSLINQMLDISKIESGRMKIEVNRGDITAYTQNLIEQFQAMAEKKDQRLAFIAKKQSWKTQFDRDKWDKIIYNLLSNAIKFTEEGGSVQVVLEKAQWKGEDGIRLEVKDSGKGIEEKHLDQIFNRFYQVDDSSTRMQEGTGIGLALVKELVELQGGGIKVKSKPGKGTGFEILLPVLQSDRIKPLEGEKVSGPLSITEEGREVPSRPAPPSGNGHKKLELLVIEDNDEMRGYIRQCIGPERYHVSEARNGEEGVKKALELIPDLIISDVMMPLKDGYEVVRALRESAATSHIPVILLTARASLESRLRGWRQGADAYLTKPFSPRELAMRIRRLIEIRQLLQQRYQNGELSDNASHPQEDEFITNIRSYVLENLEEINLNGDVVGKHLGMSRMHLHRKLKALTGQSVTELIRSVRLNRATELLREGKLNISEITYKTGFSSISQFSKTFKKVYGKAPSKMKHSNKT